MKTIITIRLSLLVILFLSTLGMASAQTFENTLGNLGGIEDVVDSKPINNGAEYVLLSNTTSYSAGVNQMLVTRLTGTGTFASSFTLYDPANPADAYVAKGMEIDLNAAGAFTGFFFTGYRLSGNTQQMVVIRTDPNGVITWAKRLNNVVNNVVYTESGISIERQSNGDIVVIGVSYDPAAVVYRPIATRLTAAAGANVWASAYRYTTAAGQTFHPNESCNGTVNGTAVVAVTGKYSDANANGRAFAFLINATTGAEVWASRRVYQSGALSNEGLDIVQNPATSRFMLVGQIFNNAGTNPDLWVVNLNSTGTIFNSAMYDLGANYSAWAGRDVCLNAAGTAAVIAGYLKPVNGPIGGVPSPYTYAMELGFGAAGAPANSTWLNYYLDSSPNTSGSESIERITGANGGYFIGTDAYLTGAANFDQHAIRTDAVGVHPLIDCPISTLQPAMNNQGTAITKTKNRVAATWQELTPNKSARDMSQEICDGVLFDGEITEERSKAANLDENGGTMEPALVFPNPTTGDATLRMALGEEQLVQVSVFDLKGRLVFSSEEVLPEGRQEMQLPAAEWVPGAYFVRVVKQEGQEMLRLNVQR